MTNTTSPATKAAKKADPFASLKSSIMMVSIAGTMAGWLLLLNQEVDSQEIDSQAVNTVMLDTAILENIQMTAKPIPSVDISQLRQVNEVRSIEAIPVVARTRSSQ